MPTAGFTQDNKIETPLNFPRLKLDKGETARILCIEEAAYEYTHNLRAPQIVDDQPVMQTTKTRQGDEIQTHKYDFVGRPLCLGDLGILKDKGVDPDNCPACKASRDSSAIPGPERRFAMHVVRYALKQGSWDFQNPFSVQLLVWSFTENIFNKLVDFSTTWGSLRAHDLKLGPCTVKEYQKYDIDILPDAGWQSSPEHKQLVVTTYKENQCQDITIFCGRKVTKAFMQEDVDKVLKRWDQVNGISQQQYSSADVDTKALTSGLDSLLADTAPSPGSVTSVAQSTTPAPAGATDLSALLDADTAASPPSTNGSVAELDNLLGFDKTPAVPLPNVSTAAVVEELKVETPVSNGLPLPAPQAEDPSIEEPKKEETLSFDDLLGFSS